MQGAVWILVLATACACASGRRAVPVTVPLMGQYNETFFYYTSVHMGTPSVPYTVIVDTGYKLNPFWCLVAGCVSAWPDVCCVMSVPADRPSPWSATRP